MAPRIHRHPPAGYVARAMNARLRTLLAAFAFGACARPAAPVVAYSSAIDAGAPVDAAPDAALDADAPDDDYPELAPAGPTG
jgi:hypothetical protein